MSITLEEVKQQCRIEHDLEDDLLNGYLLSARKTIENLTNRKLVDELPENPPPNALLLTEDLKLAVLMLTAYLYENRSGWNEANNSPNFAIPPTVEIIIQSYKFITL
ncbi:head-tail connector protein [Mannheimia indoligenes]|uniref:Head-tail connector protein n=1 Tax=Mannheimia indoligenes TaxID=3103145 RepID=A0ABU7ZEW6_9PAST